MTNTQQESGTQRSNKGACTAIIDSRRLQKRKREDDTICPQSPLAVFTEKNFPVDSYSGNSICGTGPRDTGRSNQDRLLMLEDSQTRSLLLMCLDGHGVYGEHIAQFISEGIQSSLFKHTKYVSDPQSAIRDVVQSVEFAVRCQPNIDSRFSGTTLCMALIRGNQILVSNIGNSRVVLGSRLSTGRVIAKSLSTDHTPEQPDEFKRICAAGGRVFRVSNSSGNWGPSRVWLANFDAPGLGMSRSLCDDVIHSAGVSSTLEFTSRTFDLERDCVLIVATYGLWKFISCQEAVEIALESTEPSTASTNLVIEARSRYLEEESSSDDISVCVAFLNGPPACSTYIAAENVEAS